MADQRDGTPTEHELLKLPRWARVAFAARCARRVQPLFHAWTGALTEHLEAVDTAIALSEASARGGRADDALRTAATDAAAASYPAFAARVVSGDAANHAARAAADAADAAVADAARLAARAAKYAAARGDASAAIWTDYNRLFALAQAERWSDDTPVDPDRLGPLWHFGKPDGWPADPQAPGHSPVMQLDLVIPADMTDKQFNEFEERVSNFLGSLSRLHAAVGGTGLRVLDEGSGELDTAEDQAPIDCDQTPVGTGATGGGR